jgi:hypothetical protein
MARTIEEEYAASKLSADPAFELFRFGISQLFRVSDCFGWLSFLLMTWHYLEALVF